MPRYTVQENETLLDIVRRELDTHDVRAVLRDPLNRPLFGAFRTEHALLPGDELELPSTVDRPEPPSVAITTGRLHHIVATAPTRRFDIRLLDEASLPIDGAVRLTPNRGAAIDATADAQGWIRERIDVRATEVELELDDGTRFTMLVGGLDPAHTIRGVQGRLRNLGFYDGPVDGEAGASTQFALRRFQRSSGLPVDGVASDRTVDALVRTYGE